MSSHHQHHDPRSLIIGGEDIVQGRYPYFVSIDKNNGVIVSGALIAPDIVLSAGHITLNHMDNLTVKVGPYQVHQDEQTAETIPVADWVLADNWDQFAPLYFANDYVILQLAHAASASQHPPVTLNRNAQIPTPGTPVVMTGLGWTNATYQSPADTVQQVELLSVGSDECAAAHDPARGLSYQNLIVESMFCTRGPPGTVRDGCAWDSGAPVIVAGDTSETDLLIGLGSTGVGCADPIFPAIQARVSTGWEWIRKQVCSRSVDPPGDFHCHNNSTKPMVGNNETEDLNDDAVLELAGNETERPQLAAAIPATTASLLAAPSLVSHQHENTSLAAGVIVIAGLAMLTLIGTIRRIQRTASLKGEHAKLNLHQQFTYDSVNSCA